MVVHFAKPTFGAVKFDLDQHRQPDNEGQQPSSEARVGEEGLAPKHEADHRSMVPLIPAFTRDWDLTTGHDRDRMREACDAWLARSPSRLTRQEYTRDLQQFLHFLSVPAEHAEILTKIRPQHVAAWRDQLRERGLANSSIRRKMTVLRSLFSYLRTYGYTGANPAHSDFVEAPAVPRDGKTVGLSPQACRLLIDAPDTSMPAGVRDRAILAVLAYSACRVGELARLQVGDYKTTGGHKVLEVLGKGGKERRVPLHPEAMERLEEWLDAAGIRDDVNGPLFRAARTARAQGRDGFRDIPLSRRAIQLLVKKYVTGLGLDSAVSVHSFRVTALTTAREQGVDIIDLQDFAGHADPRTTLSYIRSRDRLSKSPAYVLRYF
jgi:integrase/recombinase XerD